jgi:hypothetical protein
MHPLIAAYSKLDELHREDRRTEIVAPPLAVSAKISLPVFAFEIRFGSCAPS